MLEKGENPSFGELAQKNDVQSIGLDRTKGDKVAQNGSKRFFLRRVWNSFSVRFVGFVAFL